MLVPDNIHPEHTLYYNGGLLLKLLKVHGALELLDLYRLARQERDMSMPVFMLSLDWLFLINLINLDQYERVVRCS